ncbi:NAD(P)-binding protein [Rhizodiscina lignyota]|uniref:NAD(P)-binding protein n=1 Tax=Rhizodiscina lignyota TaxID=1504668 RepID=A0A9P4IIT1_9PEZI|nr:NAD(P)-binding protein [Rhizodiscina lignyota]
MTTPVWLITASSSGFGKAIAIEALGRGHNVIATARSVSKIDDLRKAGAVTMALDVTDSPENLKKLIADAYSKYGHIDYLINAAGYMLEGAVEEASPEETYQQFNVNVFGNLNVTRAVLPYMRQQRSGVVAMFGSAGSYYAVPSGALYCATKWACSAIGEGLRLELEDFGITATVIEPGYFRTGFLNQGAMIVTKERLEDYEETAVGKSRNLLSKVDNKQPGNVVEGARVTVDVLTSSGVAEGQKIPLRIVLGSDCEQTIRDKFAQTTAYLDEWKDVIRSTDYPEGQ